MRHFLPMTTDITIQLKELPGSKVEITAAFSAKKTEDIVARAAKDLSQAKSIHGFRSGHAPPRVVRASVGDSAFLSAVAQIAAPEAIARSGVRPIARPNADLVAESPLQLKITAEVFPKVDLPKDWQALKPKIKEAKVPKKDIADALKRIAERFATNKEVSRAAKKDDHVEIDFEGTTPDGVPLEGASSKNHPLILGLGTFIPGFEDALIGAKAGDEKTFTLTFPADYHAAHLKGKPVVFSCTINKVHERVPAEIGPELAQQIFGQPLSKKEMEQKVEEVLQSEKDKEAARQREEDFFVALEKKTKIEVPESFIARGAQAFLENIAKDLQRRHMTPEQFFSQSGETPETLQQSAKENGEKRARRELLVNAMVASAKPQISQEDIERQQQSQPGQSAEDAKNFLEVRAVLG